MSYAEITEIILNLSFTAFAIYGIYVLSKWKKSAQKISDLCDETHEEIHQTEKGGDECDEEETLYHFDGRELCINCIINMLEMVE